jgi:uncharacterized membrane protein YhfC
MMVSIYTVICLFVSALLSIGLPIGLFFFMRKKYGIKVVPMLTGVMAFVLFVLVLERMIHLIVLKPDMAGNITLMQKPVLYMLYGAFMAGICEETARFISFSLLKNKYQDIRTGISYGIGHGGAEAILIGGIAIITNLVFCFLINSGHTGMITNGLPGVALDKINNAITVITTMEPHIFLISGMERAMALCIQISLSIIVWHAVNKKGLLWLFPIAIVSHAIIDFPPALAQTGAIKNTYLVEIWVLAGAITISLITWAIYKKFR